MELCRYKTIFGIPNKGIHSYRFLNLAIMDIIMTIIVGYMISYILNISLIYVLILLFIMGIILHRIFCVRTTIDKLLFPNK